MRRLLVLVSAIFLVESTLYSALVPLLPDYAARHDLSKLGAGLLVASYAAGVLLGALPSALAATRLGPRQSVVGGLALLSVASLAFGFADDASSLGLARLAQGFGSALSWTGGLTWLVAATPRERRGEMLGTAFGAAVVGALLGPAVGGVAGIVGPRPAFAAVAALAVLLLLWALRTAAVAADAQPLAAARRVLGEPAFAGGIWLMILPALLFGVLVVLVPLELGSLGWGAAAIGAVFLTATAFEAGLNPLLGRVSDRRGRLLPVRIALVASLAVSLALAWASHPAAIVTLVVAASLSYGAFWTPALALISDGADRRGVPQAHAFGIMNAAWAAGAIAGPAAAGALADVAGDALPYAVLAGICLVTIAAVEAAPASGTRALRVPKET